jgi:hypothetical protein
MSEVRAVEIMQVKGQTYTLDFLAFSFVQPAPTLLNSTPQPPARDRRTVAQGAQLGPGDLRMPAAAQAAVGALTKAVGQLQTVVFATANSLK